MKLFHSLRALAKSLFHRSNVEREMDEELRSHIQHRADDLERSGLSRAEAERRARIEFGAYERVREESHEAAGAHFFDPFRRDLRYAMRMLRKSPGFTSVAVLTLALGIGANTALFSVIDAVLLRPLPFRDPGRLVAVRAPNVKDSNTGGEISYPAFLDWRSQSRSFEAMSVWNMEAFTYTGGSQAESVPGVLVSASLFSMLGVSPILGRDFSPDDDKPGDRELPVMLSFEFWQSHFGGDRNIAGRALTLDNQKYQVAGVMPAGFQFPVQSERVELWTTIAHDLQGPGSMASQRGVSYLNVIGRLKPGVQISQALADLKRIQDELNRQYPENHPKMVSMQLESDAISGSIRPVLLVLLGTVAFVLLIACANVANLLLARATARQKEITIRSALGASRGTIIRQLLTESVLLAMLGAGLGLLVAQWAVSGLLRMAPAGLARTSEIGLDLRVLGFTFLIALLTGVLFGLAPVVQLWRADAVRSLGDSSRGTSSGPAGSRMRGVLVASQLAVAFMLLTGAGLLLRSFNHLRHVDPGFRSDHVLTFLLEIPSDRYKGAQRPAFVSRFLDSARALPGVKSASAIFGMPLSDQTVSISLDIEGRPIPKAQRPRVDFRLIDSDYFSAMGIPLIQGRVLTPQDEEGKKALAIVNEAFVRQNFPGENPLGRHVAPNITFGMNGAPMREIIGVVGDVKADGISGTAPPDLYAPITPVDFISVMTVVVRTATNPTALTPALRSLVASMDKDIPVRDVKTLDEYVSASISTPRFEALLLAIFAGLAFVLTAIGLYGTISYSVAQRMREMGIRMALGAQRANILTLVLRQGTLLTVIGAAAGLVASLLAARLVRHQLYGIGATDPVTFIAVPLLLMAVALLASYIPARRATRVDPIVVLREE